MKADANKVRQLTRKLKEEGDISVEEADEIYPEKKFSSRELKIAMEKWYDVVAEKIRKGLRGNFIFTIDIHRSLEFMEPAQKAIRKYGNFEDLCDFILVDKRLYSLIPFKHLFVQEGKNPLFKNLEFYYEMRNSRAGMYYYPIATDKGIYTISQFMKRFYSIPAFSGIGAGALAEKFFEIAAGIYDKPLSLYSLNSIREVKYYILADFMKQKKIPCLVATALYDNKSILFVEEENALAVKKVLEAPLERLVDNAFHNKVIDEKTAQKLLANDFVAVSSFPIDKFVKVSVEYLDETNEAKVKMMRDRVEEETEWIEEIRRCWTDI